MRIVIVTDAWEPQVNGVVRTLLTTRSELTRRGHIITVIAPDQYRSVACPSYPEIRLALTTRRAIGVRIAAADADAVHIATEGPLGIAARAWCMSNGLPFTTAYHTQFPAYVAGRTGLPESLFWRYIRWFHAPSAAIMAATPTLRRELAAHGLPRTRSWGRGVDLDAFTPDAPPPSAYADLPRPILLNVGRVAIEKNIAAFLDAPAPGSKVVVGDGPLRLELERKHPGVIWLGTLHGDALAGAYAGADAFVFPSLTDTFGLVMVEALACGTPVAAYPVAGPIDVLVDDVGCMAENLGQAIAGALTRDRAACSAYARRFSWSASADQFLAALAPLDIRAAA